MATTSYITPIMDRKREDVEYARLHQNDLVNKNKGAWNYTDLNRICNNIKYAAEYMYDQGFLFEPYPISIKTDWTESDIITYDQLNTMILLNINNLKEYSRPDLKWHPISSLVNINYITANWIEENIHQLATQEPLPPDKYTLTIIDGTGSGEYEPLTKVEIRANPAPEGQVFSHWSGDRLEYIDHSDSEVAIYEMPLQNVTLRANYTSAIPHTLTIITYSGTETVNLFMGRTKHIEADPAPMNKVFHHWDVNPSIYENNLYEPAATTTFTMPNEAVTLTAVYITKGQKQLVVQNGNGSGYYEYDTYAAVSSNKPANAVFTQWTGDTQYLTGPVTQEYNSVRIPDVTRITIRANWTVPPVTNIRLTVNNGVISSTGETTGLFTEGDRVSITANAVPSGQIFNGWSKSGGGSISGSSSMNATVTIGTSNTTVTANYRTLEYYTLTVITNSGTTTTTKERYDTFTINANPAPSGQTFARWTGDVSGISTTSAYTSGTMGAGDRTITATYRSIDQHTLTVKQPSGDVTYTQSEYTTVQIYAENAPAGKIFTGWSLSGAGSLSYYYISPTTYTFGNGDATLTPNYVNVWTINVIDGTIDGATSKTLRQGSTYDLRTRGLAVYEKFDGWTKSGPGSISNTASPNTYFVVGEGNATITANISQYPDKILTIYQRDPSTSIDTLVSQETYTYGSRIEIEAPTAPNQTTFSTWLGDVNMLSPSALASTIVIPNLTADTTIIATYYYPESPEYYTLTVVNGTPPPGQYAVGSQISIHANTPSQGWEFSYWENDTQFLVDPDLTLDTNSVIMPAQSITLEAKYNEIGKLPTYRVSVTDGEATGEYITDEGTEQEETHIVGPSSYIDVPEGAQVTLTANQPVEGKTFSHWTGNFEAAGVIDIVTTNNPTVFTMVRKNINARVFYRDLEKCTVIATNANGYAGVNPGRYSIQGNLVDTDDIHYTFTGWTCVDENNVSQISKIADPTSTGETTTIELSEGDTLWLTANYTANYKLTVVGGQDTGDHYYYENEIINSVYANTPETGMQFDHWEDPVGIITTNIYDKTPTIKMKDSIATITAVFTSTDASGNSVVVTGNNLHTGTIYRSSTSLINGIFAVGTIVFDADGCIGMITQVDPDQSDDTDDFSVNKLFYGGNF